MELGKLKREYINGDLTIIWQPELCKHSGICAKNLPKVFRPKDKPWIVLQNAEANTIIDIVNKCPSGAISVKAKKPSIQNEK